MLIINLLGVILWLKKSISGKIYDKKLAQQLEFIVPYIKEIMIFLAPIVHSKNNHDKYSKNC
ncbi:MAG: hypothetical protein EAZ70_04525 [Runella slithyformis]|nr:MAG: hypothetical protein EAZ70_04525 [Runella slithyformis]TAF82736.1 MAG: hypothetical protein EAZ50_03015 [Runella slithyformis]